MPKNDEVSKSVNKICQEYQNDPDHVVLTDIWELNDLIDEIFEPYEEDYANGSINRELTLEERSQILEALCTVYSVKNMSQQELNDNLFSEYID